MVGNNQQVNPIIENSGGQSVSNPQLRLFTNADDASRVSCYPIYFPGTSTPFSVTQVQLQIQLNGCTTASYPNIFQGVASGTAWIHAQALVYGVMLEDSVLYTVTNVTYAYVYVYNTNLNVLCGGCQVTIAPGGSVVFTNYVSTGLSMGMAVTFDNPEAATAGDADGNVEPIQPGASSVRTFLTPGTYGFTIQMSDAPPPFTNSTYRGSIVVQ